jgi:Putative MetA-pathway of phenol degradation
MVRGRILDAPEELVFMIPSNGRAVFAPRRTSRSSFLGGGLVLGLLAVTLVPCARADHPSATVGVGAARPLNTESGMTLPARAWSVGLRSEYIDFDEFSDGRMLALQRADPDADVHSVESLLSLSLGVFYGLTDDLTVGLRVPYLRRTGLREPFSGTDGAATAVVAAHSTDEHSGVGLPGGPAVLDLGASDGLGDVTLFGQYRVLEHPAGHHLSLLAGLKTPTGRTSVRSGQGLRLETDLQPGSGSWDGLLGLAYTRLLGRVSLDGSVLYTIVSEGAQRTDLGDTFAFGAAVAYRVQGEPRDAHGHDHDDHDHTTAHANLAWDLVLEVNGEWRDQEHIAGALNGNSDGTVLYLSPGLRLTIAGRVSFGVSVGVPLVTDLLGDQVDPSYRVISSMGVGF